MPENALDGLIDAIVAAKRIVVFGLGREGLQMRGFAMRLFSRGPGRGELAILKLKPGFGETSETMARGTPIWNHARRAG